MSDNCGRCGVDLTHVHADLRNPCTECGSLICGQCRAGLDKEKTQSELRNDVNFCREAIARYADRFRRIEHQLNRLSRGIG